MTTMIVPPDMLSRAQAIIGVPFKPKGGWTLSQCNWANDQLRGPVITSTASSFSARSPQFAVLGGATETISLTVENQRTGGAPVALLRYWNSAGQVIAPDSPTKLLSVSGRHQSVLTHPVDAARAAFIVQDAGGSGYFDFGLAMINPGSEAAPFVDSETSASFAATLVDHQRVLIELDAGKASAEDLQQISTNLSGLNGEVEAAVGRLDQAQSQLEGKASATALEQVEARTTATEADVLGLETALATEAGARAEAINQLSARQAVRPNHVPNGGLADGARGWLLNGGAVGVVNPVRGRVITGSTVNWSALSEAFPVFGGNPYFIASSLLSQRNGGSMGVRLRYYSDAAAQVDGPGQSISNGVEIAGSGEERKSIGSVAPSNAIRARAELYAYAGSGGYSDAGMVMVNAGTLPAPFNDLTADAELSASVTEQSLAIIDLTTQQALARFELAAQAAGGLPALFRLVSSSLGSYGALIAPVVALLNNIPGGDPLVVMEARNGKAFFARAVSVDHPTENARLIVGPTAGGTILWFGTKSFDADTATRTNARWAFGTDLRVYYGGSELGGGSPSTVLVFQSGAGAGTVSRTLNIGAASKLSFAGSLEGGSLATNEPLYARLTLTASAGGQSQTVGTCDVVLEPNGNQLPGGSWEAQSAGSGVFSARSTITGTPVTYALSVTRTGGANFGSQGSVISGELTILPLT